MSDLYRENILEYAKNPHNYGRLAKPDASAEDTNPLCGDWIAIEINCDTQVTITNVGFTAKGCALSIASSSLLCDSIKGKNIIDIQKLASKDIEELLGIKITMGRIKCVLLPLVVLQKTTRKIETNYV